MSNVKLSGLIFIFGMILDRPPPERRPPSILFQPKSTPPRTRRAPTILFQAKLEISHTGARTPDNTFSSKITLLSFRKFIGNFC